MSLLLIIGDTQIESKPACDRIDDDGRSIRFKENLQVIDEALEAGKAAGCTGLVHLGDVCEERNPDSLALDGAASFFGKALSWGWDVLAICGNHDTALYKLSGSTLAAFARLNTKFRIFHEPETVKIGDRRLLMLPYLHRQSPEQVTAAAAACGGADFIFAHYAYAGVQIGAKNMVLPGDHLDSTIFSTTGAKTAFFGHIHQQQIIQAPNECSVVFPGSPFCVDFGERKDPKGYAILDTETGKWQLFKTKPKRRWAYIDWKTLGTPSGAYAPEDIIKVTGEYGPGESPQDAFKALLASGKIVEPFYKTFGVQKAAQAAKRGIVTAASGLQQALVDYFAATWTTDDTSKKALEAAIAALKSSSPAAYDKSVLLKSVHMVDFLSHEKASMEFHSGEPTLICGENGLGKTNLIEAVLFALTGQVSKGLKMASLVRQGASKAKITLLMAGEKGEYRINRTVTLNTKGAASHKVEVEIKGERGWTSLADGGVADTQSALQRLVGATFLSMRAVNFQFQRDPNPFIGAEPSERKAILSEILGLDALGRAHKVLNDERLIKMRGKDAAEAVSNEAATRYNHAQVTTLENGIKDLEAEAPGLKKALVQAKAVTEAAVAAAGAIGSERNSLQSVIDALDGQADGASGLKKSKTDIESAYALTYAERLANYAAAKKRAMEKAVLARDLPLLLADSAKKDAEEIRINAMTAEGIAPDLIQKEAQASSESAVLAKVAVDARLNARQAQQAKSDASAKRDALREKVKTLDFEIDTLKSSDLKACSKCNRPFDASHTAEAELKKAEADLVLLKADLAAAETYLTDATAVLTKEQGIETASQASADAAAKKLNIARTALETAVKDVKSQAKADALAARNAAATAKLASQDAEQAERERADLMAAGTKAKEDHEKTIKDLEASIQAAEQKAAEAKVKADEAREKLANIDARLTAANADVKVAKLAETSAQMGVDQNADSLTQARAGIEAQNEHAANAELKLREFNTAKDAWAVADRASQSLDPKAGLPVHLIDERLPVIADLVNAYLNDFGSPEFSIAFSTRKDDGKESLEIIVDNGSDPRLDVAAYSGGQLDRIEFCVRMALGDLAEEMRDVKLGFIMMDEPGTHLDEEKKDALIRIVKQRAADGKCPIAVIVSHDRKLLGAFDRRLTVTRDGMREG